MKSELSFRPVVFIVTMFLVVPIAGCSPATPTGTVSGKVMLGNAPLTLGKIIFIDDSREHGGGASFDEEGHYVVSEKIPVGKYNVYIANTMKPGGDPSSVVPTPVQQKYKSADTSGLTFEIKEGENTADFTLEK